MTKNTTPLEAEEQEAFCEYLKSRNILFTSTQNGAYLGSARFIRGKKLKDQGMTKGFPDLIIFLKNQSKTADVLFIEMKRQKGGIVSGEQQKWIDDLSNNGYMVGVAKGCESAIRILKKYEAI